MSISEHIDRFAGLPVRAYEPAVGLVDPTEHAYRIESRRGYPYPQAGCLFGWLVRKRTDSSGGMRSAAEQITRMADDPRAAELSALVIGPWRYDSDPPSAEYEALRAAAERFTGLRALFIGDVIQEECEISWLGQGDVGPLLGSFPQLEILQLRGGNGLRCTARSHAGLRRLVVQSGGLAGETIRDIAAVELPSLERLELWLGDGSYGADWEAKDLQHLLGGGKLPSLTELALRNSDRSDEIAALVADSPLFERLDELDLSMGTLGDAGGRALLASPHLRGLKRLQLRHHYLSDGVMAELLAAVGDIDLEERQAEEDGMRMCEVAE